MLSGLIGLSACRTFQLLVADGFAAAEPFGVGGFEIGYVTDNGLEHRVSLSQAWATPFVSCSPIRLLPSTSHRHSGEVACRIRGPTDIFVGIRLRQHRGHVRSWWWSQSVGYRWWVRVAVRPVSSRSRPRSSSAAPS